MSRKNTGKIFLFIVILACLVLQGFAQKSSNVAIVNYEKAFQNSDVGRKALIQLQEKEQKINKELADIDKQLQTLESKLDTQKLILSFDRKSITNSKMDNAFGFGLSFC